MDLKQIEKLMAAMANSSMKRVVLKQGDFEIELEKECRSEGHPPLARASTPSSEYREPERPHSRPQELIKHAESPPGKYVTSPMVGTYYSSPSPEDPPFVKVGDSVEEDTVLCIIEAMKVMNEVKAGVKGKIADILLKSGAPVEFGSNIFRVEE